MTDRIVDDDKATGSTSAPSGHMMSMMEEVMNKMAKCGCGPMMAQMMGKYFACQEGDPGQSEQRAVLSRT